MTLAEWSALQSGGVMLHPQGGRWIPDADLQDRGSAWHLSDYVCSSVSGGALWFVRRVDHARS